ncbi:MAG: hypothetical protein WC054_01090 [Candidatus Nanopelagicales bacterium]
MTKLKKAQYELPNKSDVGLGNVDNTSDANKPVSSATQTALDGKQALDSDLTTIAGLTATTNNVLQSVGSSWASRTPAQLKATLGLVKSDVGLGNVDNTADSAKPVSSAQQTALDGKQPLDSDLTTIAGLTATTDNVIQSVGSAWASRTPAQLKTSLALSKSDVGLANVDNTADASKPVSSAQQSALDLKAPLASPAFTGTPTGITKTHVGLGNVDNTSDANKPISSATQTALDGKQASDSDLTTIAALDASTAGAIASDGAGWIKKTYAQFKTALGLVKADVGLGNVDNTSDSSKPVSSATQSALDLKAPLASPAFTGTPTGITKTHVGLGNVDNTSDANKPVSSAQQTALDGKQPLDADLTAIAALTATTDNVVQSVAGAWSSRTPAQLKATLALAKGDVGLGNVDNTSDANKPISTAEQTALNLKQDLSARGAASGYAPLDGSSKVPYGNLPVGTAASTVAAGDDSRMTNARVPTTHAFSHSPGQPDSLVSYYTPKVTFDDHVNPAANDHTNYQLILGPYSVKTASYTLVDTDGVVVFNTASAAMTATLPTAAGRTGRRFIIKKLAGSVANALTIDPNGTETIDGQLTEVISMSGGFREVISDGANWHIVGGRVEPVITTLSNVANGGTINVDSTIATVYRVTTTGATATLAVPTQGIDGDQINYEITANAALTLTLNGSLLLTSGIATPIAVPINKRLFLGLRNRSGTGWFVLAAQIQS